MPDLSELFLYNGELKLEFIVWPIFIGICIAAFVTVFVRVKLGEVVRAIFSAGAVSPETAKTLEELGVANKFFVRSALRGRSALRRVVDATDGTEIAPDENGEGGGLKVLSLDEAVDLDKCRFFIVDKNIERAEGIYDNTNSTLLSAGLTVIIAFAVAALSMVIIPNLQQMLDNMLENLKNK